jgi:hypothetical protein
MHTGLLVTRSLRLLCIALMLAQIRCNPEKQWQLDTITGHSPNLCVTASFAAHVAIAPPRAVSPAALYYPSYYE